MRWQVEVTSMDRADAQSVVVDAESWQKALQAARASRGEQGPISGFSIELLDEGYRAVDPLARLRYDVKRATDGAATTNGPSANAGARGASAAPPRPAAKAASVAPAAPVAPAQGAPTSPAAAPKKAAAPAPTPSPPVVAPAVPRPAPVAASAPTPAPAPVITAPAAAPPAPAPAAPVAVVVPVPPPSAPSASPRAPAVVAAPPRPAPEAPDATIKMDAAAAETLRVDSSIELDVLPDPSGSFAAAPPPPPRPPPAPHVAAPAPPPAPAPVFAAPAAADAGPVPPTQVIFKREHDPTERLPLTYREYVYAVARGVDEVASERLLRAQLDQVRASIASSRPGKFVQLAVFDVVFQGRPPVLPLATLAWKDWVGEPVVSFPRRGGAAASVTAARAEAGAPASVTPAPAPIAPQPVLSVVPAPPAERPVASSAAPAFHPPGPATPAQLAPEPPHAPHAPVASVPAAPVFPAPVVPAPVFPPPAAHVPAPSAPPPPAPPAPVAANPFAAPPAPVPTPLASHVVADPFAPGVAPLPPGVPVPVANAAAPAAPAFEPAQAAAPAPAPARRANDTGGHHRPSASKLTPTPSRPSLRPLAAGRRATGDELIANLFEAMHELHFARDVIEGGDYVLALALEMIPSRSGIVHLYDIDRREFVIANVSGPATDALLNRRYPEAEPLLTAAMRKRRAVVIPDARADELGQAERFATLGGAASVVCSPVLKGGRFLGAIEIVNPLDGIPYTDHEGNALDYISEQFAEFVNAHGMQLDPARIARTVPPAPL